MTSGGWLAVIGIGGGIEVERESERERAKNENEWRVQIPHADGTSAHAGRDQRLRANRTSVARKNSSWEPLSLASFERCARSRTSHIKATRSPAVGLRSPAASASVTERRRRAQAVPKPGRRVGQSGQGKGEPDQRFAMREQRSPVARSRLDAGDGARRRSSHQTKTKTNLVRDRRSGRTPIQRSCASFS